MHSLQCRAIIMVEGHKAMLGHGLHAIDNGEATLLQAIEMEISPGHTVRLSQTSFCTTQPIAPFTQESERWRKGLQANDRPILGLITAAGSLRDATEEPSIGDDGGSGKAT